LDFSGNSINLTAEEGHQTPLCRYILFQENLNRDKMTTLTLSFPKLWAFHDALLSCCAAAARQLETVRELLTSSVTPENVAAPSSSDEMQLVQEIRNGNREKYRQLVDRHQSTISQRMWKFSRLPNQHEELVQEVFVEAYLSLRNFRGDAPFEHWLQKIATRVGYRFWKKRRQTRDTQSEQIQDIPAALEEGRELAAEEAAAVVYRLLARLSTEDRLVMTLLHLEEYSVAEIAQQMNWSESNVKVRAHRARKKLAEWLREDQRD